LANTLPRPDSGTKANGLPNNKAVRSTGIQSTIQLFSHSFIMVTFAFLFAETAIWLRISMDRISDSDSEDAGSIPAGATTDVLHVGNQEHQFPLPV
jgi:hypothetical protein